MMMFWDDFFGQLGRKLLTAHAMRSAIATARFA